MVWCHLYVNRKTIQAVVFLSHVSDIDMVGPAFGRPYKDDSQSSTGLFGPSFILLPSWFDQRSIVHSDKP